VFCRNAFIYFSPQAIKRVVDNFAMVMPTPGYLCVGASESLLHITNAFSLEQIDRAFVYVKRGADD
jgi:chemotaxis protein methyltransferase CheR